MYVACLVTGSPIHRLTLGCKSEKIAHLGPKIIEQRLSSPFKSTTRFPLTLPIAPSLSTMIRLRVWLLIVYTWSVTDGVTEGLKLEKSRSFSSSHASKRRTESRLHLGLLSRNVNITIQNRACNIPGLTCIADCEKLKASGKFDSLIFRSKVSQNYIK